MSVTIKAGTNGTLQINNDQYFPGDISTKINVVDNTISIYHAGEYLYKHSALSNFLDGDNGNAPFADINALGKKIYTLNVSPLRPLPNISAMPSVTLVNDAGAVSYAAVHVISNAAKTPLILSTGVPAGSFGNMIRFQALMSAVVAGSMNFYFFTKPLATPPADNSAFAPTNADMQNFIGNQTIAAVSAGTTNIWLASGLSIYFQSQNATGDIYVYIIAPSTFASPGGQTWTLSAVAEPLS